MEKWQKDFFEMLETVADEVDQFFLGINEIVDTVLEFSEEVGEQLQNTISTELDQYFNEFTEPFFEVYWELEEFVGEVDQPFTSKLEPNLQEHPACVGCRHYHGHIYNGNLLICGMHPYGWEDETCPDWEKD